MGKYEKGMVYDEEPNNNNVGHGIIPCCWCKDNLDGRDVHVVDDENYCNQCYYEKEKGYEKPSYRLGNRLRNHIDTVNCKTCNGLFTKESWFLTQVGNDYYCNDCYDSTRQSNDQPYSNHLNDKKYDNSDDWKPCHLCHKPFYNNGLKNINGKNYCRDCYYRYIENVTKPNTDQIDIRTIKLPLEENKELYLRGFVEKHSNESLVSFDKLFRLPKKELKNVRMIVAILNNKIIGIGGFLIMGNFATESWTVIHMEHRKQNLGTLMLETKLSIAKAEQLKAYNSTTAKQNKSSIAMLKKAKFTEIETFTGIKRPMVRFVHFLSGVYSGNHLKKLEFAIGVELK